ncbi:hypothetical protein CC86DRAFT_403565 [Ophiobolus disseminans]|uniref:NACHT-NTPase and P-loop NTPases N-terminal domain-containing protein n=1 Tax=Ophiobolus disseminans TaxID=1469910 RepID=A0A6A7ACE9_9PLEO|nr:hypothetical protein CC86DRAFT_403565 [Ophiobolus disseminans]
MEAIAAFGLAANVIQIIDVSKKLRSTSYEICQDGSTTQNSELETVVKDLVKLNDRAKSWSRHDSNARCPIKEDEEAREHLLSFDVLVIECENIAQELLGILSSLRHDGDASTCQSFIQAIKASWNSKYVAETKNRLDTIQKQLRSHVQQHITEAILRSLDASTV